MGKQSNRASYILSERVTSKIEEVPLEQSGIELYKPVASEESGFLDVLDAAMGLEPESERVSKKRSHTWIPLALGVLVVLAVFSIGGYLLLTLLNA